MLRQIIVLNICSTLYSLVTEHLGALMVQTLRKIITGVACIKYPDL